MFLWVHLVLSMVHEVSSEQELRDLIECLPKDIEEAYVSIA